MRLRVLRGDQLSCPSSSRRRGSRARTSESWSDWESSRPTLLDILGSLILSKTAVAYAVREACPMAQGHRHSGFPMKNVGNDGGGEGIM